MYTCLPLMYNFLIKTVETSYWFNIHLRLCFPEFFNNTFFLLIKNLYASRDLKWTYKYNPLNSPHNNVSCIFDRILGTRENGASSGSKCTTPDLENQF